MIDPTTSNQTNIATIMTCHNRRETTLRCLRSLHASSVHVTLVVVDDGSSDGTSAAILDNWPGSTVIQGDGNHYWARGMAMAEAAARRFEPNYLLWLNDDVELTSDALAILLATSASETHATIVVGALHGEAGEVSYSGVRRGRRPTDFVRVAPEGRPVDVDTFNGNVVLIPRQVYQECAAIDSRFAHAYADYDYGLRARGLGFPVKLAPGFVGTCTRDSRPNWLDRDLRLVRRWQLLVGRMGAPPRSHGRFLRRHGGHLWPVWFAAPYLRMVSESGRELAGRLTARNGHR